MRARRERFQRQPLAWLHLPLLKALLFLFYFISFTILDPLLLSSKRMPSIADYPLAWNIAPTPIPFVGRTDSLRAIRKLLAADSLSILAITGAAGFGKTQLAKKYAALNYEHYDIVWWFNTQQPLDHQFFNLASALNKLLLPDEQLKLEGVSKEVILIQAKEIMRKKGFNWLFIFDNADFYKQIKDYIPFTHKGARGHVIITSRKANGWPKRFNLQPFKREESIELIRKINSDINKQDAFILAETLKDHPLAVAITSFYLKDCPDLTVETYIRLFKDNRAILWKRHDAYINEGVTFATEYDANVNTVVAISLQRIKKQSPHAADILLFLSLFHNKDIPEAYIEIYLKLKKLNEGLFAFNHYIYAQSLLETSKTTDVTAKRVYAVHDLVQLVLRDQMNTTEFKDTLEYALETLLEVFSGRSDEMVQKILYEPLHLKHAEEVSAHAKEKGIHSPRLLKLRVAMLECLTGGLRDFEKAKGVIEDIEGDLRIISFPSPKDEALFKINKAFFTTLYAPDYDYSMKMMKDALVLLSSYPNMEEEKLRVSTNVAQYHLLRGDIEAAQECLLKCRALFSASKSAVYNVLFLFNYSILLIDQGNLKEALVKCNQAQHYFPALQLYPTLEFYMLAQKAEAEIKSSQYDAAIKTLELCEDKTKKFFQGQVNTLIENCSVLRALMDILKGNVSTETIKRVQEALKIYDQIFHGPSKHRNQAFAYTILGMAYEKEGRYQEAYKSYLKSEEAYNHILTKKTIDDLSWLYSNLALLGLKLKDPYVTKKYLQLHIQHFGHDHPRTIKIHKILDHYHAAS